MEKRLPLTGWAGWQGLNGQDSSHSMAWYANFSLFLYCFSAQLSVQGIFLVFPQQQGCGMWSCLLIGALEKVSAS